MYVYDNVSVRQDDCSTFHASHLQASHSSVNIASGLGNKRKSKHNRAFKNSGYKRF